MYWLTTIDYHAVLPLMLFDMVCAMYVPYNFHAIIYGSLQIWKYFNKNKNGPIENRRVLRDKILGADGLVL